MRRKNPVYRNRRVLRIFGGCGLRSGLIWRAAVGLTIAMSASCMMFGQDGQSSSAPASTAGSSPLPALPDSGSSFPAPSDSGSPSVTQSALIEQLAQLRLHLAVMNRKFAETGEMLGRLWALLSSGLKREISSWTTLPSLS